MTMLKLASPLIKGISRVLQKLLKYFNGTIISTSFSLPSLGVFPVIFILDLNDSESAKLSFGSSLYIATKFQMFLHNYLYILLNYTLAL